MIYKQLLHSRVHFKVMFGGCGNVYMMRDKDGLQQSLKSFRELVICTYSDGPLHAPVCTLQSALWQARWLLYFVSLD